MLSIGRTQPKRLGAMQVRDDRKLFWMAMPFVVFISFSVTCRCEGWSVIVYLAAISGIDHEVMETAEVDGAGSC